MSCQSEMDCNEAENYYLLSVVPETRICIVDGREEIHVQMDTMYSSRMSECELIEHKKQLEKSWDDLVSETAAKEDWTRYNLLLENSAQFTIVN